MQSGLDALELVLREWQKKGATVAISCTGSSMQVVFSGRIREPRIGTWIIGNGRVGLSFDLRHATGTLGDPAAVPAAVQACVGTEFAIVMELLLETGDECWLGELRTPTSG